MCEFMVHNAGTFISTLAGIIVGGFITWLVSYCHYQKAIKELRVETEKSRKLINLILCVLENAGMAELLKDENGNVVDFKILKVAVHENISVKNAMIRTDRIL